jgi:hypothetical protein
MRSILIIISVFFSPNLIGAATGQKADPFAEVPSSQRARLKTRLDKFIGHHHAGRWDEVYGLLGERYKNAFEGGLSKASFLKQRELYHSVRAFTPDHAYKVGNELWWVRGCGKFEKGGSAEAVVEAYLQHGDWYFSHVGRAPDCIDCMPLDCKD